MEFKRNKQVNQAFFNYFVNISPFEYSMDTHKLDRLKINDLTSRKIFTEDYSDLILEIKVKLERPGLLIGKAGKDINELEKYLSTSLGCKVQIIIEDFSLWDFHKYEE